MNIDFILFFCCLSALCAGNSGIVSALKAFAGPEGGNGTINCYLNLPGSTKFFCKNQCEADDLLIKTDGVVAQRGRYSVNYKSGSSGKGIVSVTIAHLIKSDAGRYRCGLGGSLAPDSYSDFEIRVSDELDKNSGFVETETEGEEVRMACSNTVYGERKFFCKNECEREEDILIDTNDDTAQSGRYSLEYDKGSYHGLHVTITQLIKSDSGWYRCGYGSPSSPDSYRNHQVLVTADPSASTEQTTMQTFEMSTSSSAPFKAIDQSTDPSASTEQTTMQTFEMSTSSSAPFKAIDQSTDPSAPMEQTTMQTFEMSTSSSASFKAIDQSTGCFLPWVVLGLIAGVLLLAVFLLLLYIWRTRRNSGFNFKENTCDTHVKFSAIHEEAL